MDQDGLTGPENQDGLCLPGKKKKYPDKLVTEKKELRGFLEREAKWIGLEKLKGLLQAEAERISTD